MKKYRSASAGRNILRTYDLLLKEWGVPVEEADIKTPGGVTHVIMAGARENPPLVLFHGVGDDSALMWLYNAKALAESRRIYAVDTIGGPGKSEMGEGYDASFDDVRWIDGVLDGLSLACVDLVGVSHGGYLAQLYALNRPDRARRAVCISATVPASGGKGSSMKTMMKIFMPEALFPTKKNTVRLLEKLSGRHPEVFTGNPLVLEHYRWLLKGFNNMAMGRHKVTRFTQAQVDAIRNRCFYLAGEEDPFQKLGGREAALNNHMNVRFFPGAGHGLNQELAEEINGAILAALEE